MRTFLFLGLIFLGLVMLFALVPFMEKKEARGIDSFRKTWRAYGKTRAGRIWRFAYCSFLIFYLLLVLQNNEYI